MKQIRYKNQFQRGFSMIEIMVSTLVISVSVLGMTGMQITAKRAGLEAIQRTSATSLATDMIERMRSNPEALASYVSTGLGGGTITVEPTPDCSYDSTNTCTVAQLAAHDLWEWEQAIDGATETRLVEGEPVAVGGLFDPTACVSVNGGAVTVSMAWEGYQSLSDPTFDTCGSGLGKYGTDDAKRQVVSMTTFITEQ
jgi:type IV pilus assembly protein PilV